MLIALLTLSLKIGKPPSPQKIATAAISGTGFIPVAAQMATTPLSQVEQKTLLVMREEEKVARDLYREMHRLWGVSLFKSVAGEEQEHMDAMARLLARYQLPDPVGNNGPGTFVNPAMTNLYQTLAQRGAQSVEEALRACALEEEINILDLEDAIKTTTQADLKRVYSELQKDSYNHLRSFAHGLELRGIAYQGVKLPQATITAILHGPMERGFMLR
ncbi:MAG: DUF2202 domain-containing protein [Magnetococcales bacterium]|nr:DUF2202 domain-containing protein [Magnetococcales bacterium]